MAIGTPVNQGNAGGTTSATTASFTPTANSVLLALISTKTSSLPSRPTISDSLGGSWTKITDVDGPASNAFIIGSLYYQVVSGSPSAMTVSANGGTTSTTCTVIEVTGSSTDFSNYAVNANAAGDPSCTVSAPGGTSAVFGFAIGHTGNVITQVAGFTELFDATPSGATNHRIEFSYDLSSPASTLSWTSTNTNSVGVAFEVKEASAATYTMTASGSSFTLSGTAAALKASRKVVGASAAFTLSGTATGLRAGRKLGASSGGFTLTGQDATLTYTPAAGGYTLVADGAAFTLSGSEALFTVMISDDGPAFDCCSFELDAFQTCEPEEWTEIDHDSDTWTPIVPPELVWANASTGTATWERQGRC